MRSCLVSLKVLAHSNSIPQLLASARRFARQLVLLPPLEWEETGWSPARPEMRTFCIPVPFKSKCSFEKTAADNLAVADS
jgi:hypothetical protein